MKKQIKTIVLLFVVSTIVIISCRKVDFQGPHTEFYPPDVAVAWMKLQMNLNKTTAGFNPFVGDRTFGYSDLALYESVEPGIPDCQPIVTQLSGFSASSLPQIKKGYYYYWPASANAAMALITKDLFANTTQANFTTIDSLEAAFNQKFQSQATAQELQNSVDFGREVASAIFEWSKTDGGDQAYLHNTDPLTCPLLARECGFLLHQILLHQYFHIGVIIVPLFLILQVLLSPGRQPFIQKIPNLLIIK